jgi:RNA ligase
MAQISSYSKVWGITHTEADRLFDGEVVVQEKVDGSQFSFGNLGGELHCRSKGQQIGYGGNQEGMFAKAVKTADLIFRTGTLPDGMVVRCECLDKPRHNTLQYKRVPVGNIIIYDITYEDGSEKYIQPGEVKSFATMWGLEVVPTLYTGPLTKQELYRRLKEWMELESILGGTKIEGVVIKNYAKVDTTFCKMLCGKFVSEHFKEHNAENWKAQSHGSAIDQIIASFNNEAIWQKSVQHMRDEGQLVNAPQDIGRLIGEIKKDFNEEYGEMIKKKIFKEFYADIERGIMRGFPEWYKSKLQESLNEPPKE